MGIGTTNGHANGSANGQYNRLADVLQASLPGAQPCAPAAAEPEAGHDLDPRVSVLLWAARGLAPGGGFHRGRVEVRVRFPDVRRSVTVEPLPGADGLATPAGLAPVDSATATGPTAAELLRHFLSDDDRLILRVLGERGPTTAQDVCDGVKPAISRSTFFALWSNLQVRGLIEEGDKGFEVAGGWVSQVAGTR